MLAQRAINTAFNLVLLVAIPLVFYYAWHRWKHGRTMGQVLRRAGVQIGQTRYLGYCAVAALLNVIALSLWTPDLEVITREGTVQHHFVGVGLGFEGMTTALLYAVVQTGFSEELLFRGLIAGSLGRRMALVPANMLQAAIFLAPHLLLLFIMPEHWPMLILVFVMALFTGWARIRSESILGPWLLHATANLAVTINVIVRTSG